MPERLLSALTRLCRETLSPWLTGVYLHGSLAMGCFRWAVSDVDLLLVTRSPVPAEQREALLAGLLRLAPQAPPKGVELSLVLQEDCARPRCPTPYQFHYSPQHHGAALADPVGYCARMQGEDADLAAHFAVTRQRGRALWGPPPRAVFAPVPRSVYLASVWQDLADAPAQAAAAPVYTTLNLCRTLAYLTDGEIRSKAEGGLWAYKSLPEHLRQAAGRAMAAYQTDGAWSGEDAAAFAAAVFPLIRREMDAELTSRS